MSRLNSTSGDLRTTGVVVRLMAVVAYFALWVIVYFHIAPRIETPYGPPFTSQPFLTKLLESFFVTFAIYFGVGLVMFALSLTVCWIFLAGKTDEKQC